MQHFTEMLYSSQMLRIIKMEVHELPPLAFNGNESSWIISSGHLLYRCLAINLQAIVKSCQASDCQVFVKQVLDRVLDRQHKSLVKA